MPLSIRMMNPGTIVVTQKLVSKYRRLCETARIDGRKPNEVYSLVLRKQNHCNRYNVTSQNDLPLFQIFMHTFTSTATGWSDGRLLLDNCGRKRSSTIRIIPILYRAQVTKTWISDCQKQTRQGFSDSHCKCATLFFYGRECVFNAEEKESKVLPFGFLLTLTMGKEGYWISAKAIDI